LQRFNQTHAGTSDDDRIIDTAVALESTLLYGIDDELTHKLALRGATLLGRKPGSSEGAGSPESMEKLLLTTREAADMLGMGRTKLYEHLDKPGGIPVVRLGRSVRVLVDDVRQFAERQRRGWPGMAALVCGRTFTFSLRYLD
jgi:excisionase family DNA binding protein